MSHSRGLTQATYYLLRRLQDTGAHIVFTKMNGAQGETFGGFYYQNGFVHAPVQERAVGILLREGFIARQSGSREVPIYRITKKGSAYLDPVRAASHCELSTL
jgi:hypothetical protein